MLISPYYLLGSNDVSDTPYHEIMTHFFFSPCETSMTRMARNHSSIAPNMVGVWFGIIYVHAYQSFMSMDFTIMVTEFLRRGWFPNGVTRELITFLFKEGDRLKLIN